MKNINDCLKSIATDYGWKYLTYDNGKLIQLINKVGQSVAIYDHFFPLNSDTSARICDDRSLKCKLLKQANFLCDENYEVFCSSPNRILDDLNPMLNSCGEIVIKSNFRRDKFVRKISNSTELIKFANSIIPYDKILVNKYEKYQNFYSVFLVNGAVELIAEYIKPQIVGDGVSAIWELLSIANIQAFDSAIDVNKVLPKGAVLNTNWQIKAPDSKVKIVTDNEIAKVLSSIAINSSRTLGVMTGTVDIYTKNGQFYIQSIDTSLNADALLSDKNNYYAVKHLYEKAIRLLI